MQLITRLVKGLVGVVIGSLAFAGLMIPIEILVFGLNQNKDIGFWILGFAYILGGVVGWVLFSKAKLWKILVMSIVVVIVLGILMDRYPQEYLIFTGYIGH